MKIPANTLRNGDIIQLKGPPLMSIHPDSQGRYFHQYLGDGVYVHLEEDNNIWLTTQQGDRIALESQVFDGLQDWLAGVKLKLLQLAEGEDRG